MESLKLTFYRGISRAFLAVLISAIVAIPSWPTVSYADETKSEEIKDSKVVITAETVKKSMDEETAAVEKSMDEEPAAADKSKDGADEAEDEGMSTAMMVGIGAGAAAVIGVTVALVAGSGGSSDSGPPNAEEVLGAWQADATGVVQNKTYTGTYTLYAGGSHTYDIVTVTNATGATAHKTGRGTWTLSEEGALELDNDTGSVYQGTFTDKNNISLTTTNGWWILTLTR